MTKIKSFEIEIDTNSDTIDESRPSLSFFEGGNVWYVFWLYSVQYKIIRCGCIILRNLLTTAGTMEVYKTYVIVD